MTLSTPPTPIIDAYGFGKIAGRGASDPVLPAPTPRHGLLPAATTPVVIFPHNDIYDTVLRLRFYYSPSEHRHMPHSADARRSTRRCVT